MTSSSSAVGSRASLPRTASATATRSCSRRRDRVGGRIWSKQRGDLALSVGAHMFPPPDSVIGQLVTELGLEVMPITGSMLNIHLRRTDRARHAARAAPVPPAALARRSRLIRARRPEGEARRRRVHAALQRRPGDTDAAIRLRALRHRGDETFLAFLGRLHPDGVPHLRGAREPLARRSRRDLAVRDVGTLRARLGHRGPRPQHARRLGPAARRARPRARPDRARRHSRGIACAWTGRACASRTRARTERARSARARRSPRCRHRTCPACSRDGMPPEIRPRSGDVTFGPMAVLSILTDETAPMPWDDLYSILTPDLRFNMFFNHANFMHGTGPKQGSVIMVYGGGRRARALLDAREDAIRDAFLADLDRSLPPGAPAHRRDVGARSGSTQGRSLRRAAGGLRRRSSAASQTGSSWPATGSRSSSRWRRPR